ncbi:hypothetical protein SUGI_0488700 [Cryptomeria japonica]|nr:hypothetical protein SUGI_0488700 [Cryptomeria japonica]
MNFELRTCMAVLSSSNSAKASASSWPLLLVSFFCLEKPRNFLKEDFIISSSGSRCRIRSAPTPTQFPKIYIAFRAGDLDAARSKVVGSKHRRNCLEKQRGPKILHWSNCLLQSLNQGNKFHVGSKGAMN